MLLFLKSARYPSLFFSFTFFLTYKQKKLLPLLCLILFVSPRRQSSSTNPILLYSPRKHHDLSEVYHWPLCLFLFNFRRNRWWLICSCFLCSSVVFPSHLSCLVAWIQGSLQIYRPICLLVAGKVRTNHKLYLSIFLVPVNSRVWSFFLLQIRIYMALRLNNHFLKRRLDDLSFHLPACPSSSCNSNTVDSSSWLLDSLQRGSHRLRFLFPIGLWSYSLKLNCLNSLL